MVPITHEQNIICSKTLLDGTSHEQTIIRRQLFADHAVDSRPMERKKKTHRMIIPFIREMTKPVMVIQTALFTRDYNCRAVYVLTALVQIIVHIETDLYLWSLSDCKQPSLWPLLCQIYYTTVHFPWILHSSRGKFSKIVWKCFSQVFKGFKYDVFKNFVFLMNVIIFQTIEPPSPKIYRTPNNIQQTSTQSYQTRIKIQHFPRLAYNWATGAPLLGWPKSMY